MEKAAAAGYKAALLTEKRLADCMDETDIRSLCLRCFGRLREMKNSAEME